MGYVPTVVPYATVYQLTSRCITPPLQLLISEPRAAGVIIIVLVVSVTAVTVIIILGVGWLAWTRLLLREISQAAYTWKIFTVKVNTHLNVLGDFTTQIAAW